MQQWLMLVTRCARVAGTYAGQFVMEGFLELKMPAWCGPFSSLPLLHSPASAFVLSSRLRFVLLTDVRSSNPVWRFCVCRQRVAITRSIALVPAVLVSLASSVQTHPLLCHGANLCHASLAFVWRSSPPAVHPHSTSI
jgi:Mn2+/Fe2+ NRAMP family transporter